MAKPREDESLKADDRTVHQDQSATGPETTTIRPESAETIGGTIGPYKLLDELGAGGMGTVYLAEQDRPVRRRVALKVIKAGLDTQQVIARFEAERQALALMDHSNIARVLDVGTTDSGRPYFVMELVQGISITSYCDAHRVPVRERLELFLPVCRAVQHAHQKGIIHRDLKPSNILVTLRDDQPVAKIIDFGIAKATTQRLTERTLYTQYGTLVGTPDYMSPEQAGMGGLDVDTRSDVYSLGAVLYELLCGDTPLGHHRLKELDFVAMLGVIYDDEPPSPSRRVGELGDRSVEIARRRDTEPNKLVQTLQGELDWITTKALEKERTRRYESASALAADIERHLNNEPVEASPPSATYRLQKFVRRNRAPLAAAAAIAAALVGGIIVSGWQAYRATQAEHEMGIEREAALNAKGEAERLLGEVKESQRLAEARRVDAENAKQLAEESGKQLAVALGQAKEAAAKESEARKEVEKRLREADAMRLAMNSKDARQRYPQRALLLAAEAVEATRRKNEPIRAPAHQALREALDNIGGRPMIGHQNEVTFMDVTPNGRWLFTSDQDDVRRWDLATDDPAETGIAVGLPTLNHRAMAMSADGRRLVTASQTGNASKLYLWDLEAEKLEQPIREIEIAAQYINEVAFSADARWLVAYALNSAWVCDLASHSGSSPPVVLQDENTQFYRVAASPNGRWAVTLDGSRRPTVWSLTEPGSKPKPRRLIDEKYGYVQNSEISPDGRWFAAFDHWLGTPGGTFAGSKQSVKVWDLAADDPFSSPRELALEANRTYHDVFLGFLPNGRLAVTAGGRISLWDLRGEQWNEPEFVLSPGEAAEQETQDVHSVEQVNAAASDSASRWLVAVTQSGSISRWDLNAKDSNASRVLVGRHPGAGQAGLTISSSGRWLVSVSAGESPWLWDLWRQNRQAIGMELRGHDGSPYANTVKVAMGGGRLTGLGTAKPVHLPFFGMDERVRASLGLGERWLVTRYLDSTPRLWDLTAADPRRAGLRAGSVKLDGHDVAIDKSGRWVINKGSRVQIVNPDATDPIEASLDIRAASSFGISSSSRDRSLSHDGRWLALRTGQQIIIYDLDSDELLGPQLEGSGKRAPNSQSLLEEQAAATQKRAVADLAFQGGRWLQQILNPQFRADALSTRGAHIPHKVIEREQNAYFNRVIISPNGQWLTAAGTNNKWRLWDLRGSDAKPVTIDFDSHPLSVSFSPDGRWLAIYRRASSGNRLEISLWNLSSSPLQHSAAQHDLAGSYSLSENVLAFSGDGHKVASNTGGVRVWPIADDGTLGLPLTLTTRSTGGNQAIALSHDGRYLANAENQEISVWDLNAQNATAPQQVLRAHEQSIGALAFSPDGTWLVSASHDGEVRIWDLREEQVQDTVLALRVENRPGYHLDFHRLLFSHDGRWLATSTDDAVYFWHLNPAGLLDEARRLAGRDLTGNELALYRLNTPDRQRERILRQASEISKRLEKAPQDIILLRQRADHFAWSGEFSSAIDDLRMLIRLQPEDHWLPYHLLTLLAQTNQPDEYRRVGEAMAERFRDPPPANREILERVAKGCLFWAESGSDWKKVAPLADRALGKATENNHWVVPWAQIAKAMGDYRLGDYAAALEYANKGLGHPNSKTTYSIAVPGNFVKAVAHAKLGQIKEAQVALKAAKAAQAAVPTPLERWSGWNDWYMCEIMLREAEAVLLASSPPDKVANATDGDTKPLAQTPSAAPARPAGTAK
jgi:serine/threonine protein kinase/WD40 repeat protein